MARQSPYGVGCDLPHGVGSDPAAGGKAVPDRTVLPTMNNASVIPDSKTPEPGPRAPEPRRAAGMAALYRTLATAATPFVHLHLRHRAKSGKEDLVRLPERFGHASAGRPRGPLVWIHAASIGEAMSVLALAVGLHATRPGLNLLFTTGTVSSATLLSHHLPRGVLHQYAPVDLPQAARAFLDHWRPDLALWVESEFWPTLLLETRKRRIPAILLQGRLSATSLRRWRRAAGLIGDILGTFTLILAQTPADAERLKALGAPSACHLGNLKFAAPPLPADQATLDDLKAAIGARPCWLAASTHPGEEPIVGAAHRTLKSRYPGLLTLIVPRHPRRGREIAAALNALHLEAPRRAAGAKPNEASDIYIADTIGELGLWYRLALVAFIGGSLVPHGGQNPLEAARFGVVPLFGPHMENFTTIAEGMIAAHAAGSVSDEATLADAVNALLADAAERQRMAAAAKAFAEGESGVLDRILGVLQPFLDRLETTT